MPETALGSIAEGGSLFYQTGSQQKKTTNCKQLTLDLQEPTDRGERNPLEYPLARSEKRCCQLAAELAAAREAAHAAIQAKSDFLNLINHEVRTPMNGIVALVDLLNNSHPQKEQQEYLNGILASSDSLLHIINNIIDYSHLRSGELTLDREPFSPRAIIAEAVAPLMDLLRSKGLQYIQTIDDAFPDLLQGDPRRIRQIIVNLLSNAIKFTESGTIRLNLQLGVQCGTQVTLHITVADSGVGIPSGFEEKIFAPFVRADLSSTRKHGGAGLGLTIARQLAELMGGDIKLGTTDDQGSVFHFNVPIQVNVKQEERGRPAERDQRSLLQWEGRSLHILLAEDHDINRNLTERILRRLGHTVSAAPNGKKAVDICEQEGFDLILMDMEMPEMDGWEATSVIRQREAASGKHVPIIAVTAHALKGNREMLLTSGFDGYMAKPIDFVVLTKEMKRLVSV